MQRLLLLIALLVTTAIGQKEGDTCMVRYTNYEGQCININGCISAKVDYQVLGVTPTFCSYYPFDPAVICCRNEDSIVPSLLPPNTKIAGDEHFEWPTGLIQDVTNSFNKE